MSNWKEKIEAQIAFFRELEYHTGADNMQALLDVAVAADEVWGYANHGQMQCGQCEKIYTVVDEALERLNR